MELEIELSNIMKQKSILEKREKEIKGELLKATKPLTLFKIVKVEPYYDLVVDTETLIAENLELADKYKKLVWKGESFRVMALKKGDK